MTTEEQFNQALEELKAKNADRLITIWIPSENRGVEFKHLTLNQQKSLIKSSVRENLLKLDFSRNIYDIIKENIADKEVDVDKLNIIDMISIGLSYRAIDISEEYGFYIGEDFHPVDLRDICEHVRKVNYDKALKPETIVSDGFHVTVQVPTIQTDKQMNDYLFEKYKDLPDDPESVKDILADVYICEAAKYITTVDMVTGDDDPDNPPTQVNFSDFSAEQRLKAMDQIPLTILNKLVVMSDKVQDIESQLLDVEIGGENISIEINSAFFT